MQGYCDVYKWTILKRTSPEVKCLHPTSSRREMCTLSVSNLIYHKFSHGAAFYTLNGKNVNVMLEFQIFDVAFSILFNVYACVILISLRINTSSERQVIYNHPRINKTKKVALTNRIQRLLPCIFKCPGLYLCY